MATAIEKARVQLARALGKLPALGLRTDYTLTLRRYTAAVEADGLSMDPADRPTLIPTDLVVTAPGIEALTTLDAYGFERGWSNGGLVLAGDLVVKLVRTVEVEAFLNQRMDDPAAAAGGPYPEMARVEWVINGEAFQAVSWRPGALTLEVVVRRVEGESDGG